MYRNIEARPLTIEASKTNDAHAIWYQLLTPSERYDVMQIIDLSVSGKDKLNACLNYIEDNIEHYTHLLYNNAANESVDSSKISSIGWLHSHDGRINLTPIISGEKFPTIVNVSKDEFNATQGEKGKMIELALDKLQNATESCQSYDDWLAC